MTQKAGNKLEVSTINCDLIHVYIETKQTTESPVFETVDNETEKSWKDVAKDALCNNDGNSSAVLDALFTYNPEVNWFVSITR